MPIPLHLSPFLPPPGAPDLAGSMSRGLQLGENMKQGKFDRQMKTDMFAQQKAQDEEQRRQFNEQHGVNSGYLGVQQDYQKDTFKRRELEEQSKLLQEYVRERERTDVKDANGKTLKVSPRARMLEQEIQRRGLSYQPRGMGGMAAPPASAAASPPQPPSPPNPFDMGMRKPAY
jgi:hypothetical protein